MRVSGQFAGEWTVRMIGPSVQGIIFEFFLGANLIWNRAMSPSLAERPSAKLCAPFLQVCDSKRFGSANGNRTRILPSRLESVSYRKPGITLLMNLTHFSRFVQSLYAAGRIRDGIQWSTAQQNRSGLGLFSALPKTQAVLAAVIHTMVSAPRGESDEGEKIEPKRLLDIIENHIHERTWPKVFRCLLDRLLEAEVMRCDAE